MGKGEGQLTKRSVCARIDLGFSRRYCSDQTSCLAFRGAVALFLGVGFGGSGLYRTGIVRVLLGRVDASVTTVSAFIGVVSPSLHNMKVM